jgi:CRP-like cAMP-binding protein
MFYKIRGLIMENPIWSAIKVKKDKGEDIFKVLKEVPIFSDLSKKELREVEKIMYCRFYKKKEPIFRIGDPGLGMYVILKGTVEIVEEIGQSLPSGQQMGEDKKSRLALLKDGAFLGELALLDELPRSASAIAMEDCEILGFFRPDLMDLIKRKPKLGNKILLSLAKLIGERLRQTNKRVSELEKNTSTYRVNGTDKKVPING